MPSTFNKKIKVVVFGNCQSRSIANMLEANLDPDKYSIAFLINNTRSRGFKGEEKAYSVISKSDVLICQPLGKKHNILSIGYIRESLKNKCKIITYPYIFNSGIQSLGYVYSSRKNSYGEIYGSDAIIKSISEHGLDMTLDLFKKGNIDFSLLERFNFCIDELKARETNMTVKLADYIMNNYQQKQLFITHNHPTKMLFKELIRQVLEVLELDSDSQRYQGEYEGIDELVDTGAGYSPYDVEVHKYKFGYHSDWLLRGNHLIEIIYKAHFLKEQIPSEIYESEIKYPDVKSSELSVSTQ